MLEFREARPEEMDNIYRLRYRVYGLEKHFIDPQVYPNGKESDNYDQHSIHYVAVKKIARCEDKILGVLRLVMGSKLLLVCNQGENLTLPIAAHFELHQPVDIGISAELSRLIVAPEERQLTTQILGGLICEAYRGALEYKVNNLYAVLEVPLLKMLRRIGLPFEDAGKENWYYNSLNIPELLQVDKALKVLPSRNPTLYRMVTSVSRSKMVRKEQPNIIGA